MSNSAAITVYGIVHCDTVKKSRDWFTQRGLAYRFHDFKKQGVPVDRLPDWMTALGWEKLVNRQGNTWRQLDAAAQAAVCDPASASALMQAQASVIKRPVVEWQTGSRTRIGLGFAPGQWQSWLDELADQT